MITKLRRAMFEREITSKHLASLSNVSDSTIRYLRLGRKPNKETAEKIARALKLAIKELF